MNDSFINRKFRYSCVNLYLILIGVNTLIYFMISYANVSIRGVPLYYYLALSREGIRRGYYWQFFTYMFVHASWSHLFFNMFALLNFGFGTERRVGSREFALFYFLCGTLCGVFSFFVYMFTEYQVFLVGASGAVYAVLLLCAVLFPYDRVLLFLFLPLRMPVAAILFFLIEMCYGLFLSYDSTAHLTHLFGLVVAFFYCVIRLKINPLKVFAASLRRRE